MRIAATGLLASSVLVCACGFPCTDVGCNNFLAITFPTGLPPGNYVIEIGADAMNWRCEALVPLGADHPQCTGRDVQLVTSRTSVTGVRLEWAPKTAVTLKVTRDGNTLSNQTVEPGFKETAPNGEGCGPVCQNATVTLDPEAR